MAGIQELVLTFLDSLSHDALRFNRKRETLDARIGHQMATCTTSRTNDADQ